MRICIICSGVSEEKGISINSGKSIYEILESYKYIKHLSVVFIDQEIKFYLLKKEFLFSNTVEDFIHQYKNNDHIYDPINFFKTFDKVFLTTHGNFGEDGRLQKILEENNIPFVGPSSLTAEKTFLKKATLETIWKKNICKPWLSVFFQDKKQLEMLFLKHKMLCIKPNDSGSSIGVKFCYSVKEALEHIEYLKQKQYTPLIEEVHKGREFTINLVNGKPNEPTEIINDGIYTYEKKYFPSEKVSYKHPASFPLEIRKKIKDDCIQIYNLFKARDFFRVDGFYDNNANEIIYTDLNTIPGFQLNGLFFRNRCHFDVIQSLLQLPKMKKRKIKKEIFLIFGGDSSEKNVSIISSGNVLFNLSKYPEYKIHSFLFCNNKFWPLSYEQSFQTSIQDFKYILKNKQSLTINKFVDLVKSKQGTIFNSLHGGDGENGRLQIIFEKSQIKFTGSNSKISKLCMDKHKTNLFLQKHLKNNKHIYFPKEIFLKDFTLLSKKELDDIWSSYESKIFIKPNDDGCSVGATVISSVEELYGYHQAVINKSDYFNCSQGTIPISLTAKDYIVQEMIETDKVISSKGTITYMEKTNWFEGTVGFIYNKIFTPSACLTSNNLLTMEEKFLQGTGTNLTPIPGQVVNAKDINIIKKTVKTIINLIGIDTYCRIDFFYNRKTKKIFIIEVNTLPALTPATVLFHQAIYANLTPRLLLNKILSRAVR